MRKQIRNRAGFTLTELMIVVAIIGILMAVAIPGLQRYQMTSKRAEAYTNLLALSQAQKSYYSEWNTFVPSLPEPSNTSSVDPGPAKRNVADLTAAFTAVGWTPDGDVYFDYDTCTPEAAYCTCNCAACFTASAWGDLDNDGNMSGYMYFMPDNAGDTCQSAIEGHWPPVKDGQDLLQTAAWHGNTDDF